MYHPVETALQQYYPAAEYYHQAEVYHQQVAPQPQCPPNYDFAYCEAQWMYYNSQPCGQYEAYYYREAYACSYMQVHSSSMYVQCSGLVVCTYVCMYLQAELLL